MTQFRLSIHGQERALEVTRQGERLHVVVARQDPLPTPPLEGEGTTAEVKVLSLIHI